jgi:hypothetical protein
MGAHDPTVGLQARNNPVCAFWRGPGVSGTAQVDITCISTVPAARYLSIQLLNAPSVLTLCEVQWTFLPTAAGCMAAPTVSPGYGGTWSCPAAQHGATCNATCGPGLVGNMTATCNNGTWQVTGTECGITSEFRVTA